MKGRFTFFVLLLMGHYASAQIIGRFYYNRYWELTRPDSSVFFRVCVFDTTRMTFVGLVQDFTKDGKLLMKGTYRGGLKEGAFTFYYPSGQVESAGHYVNGYRAGRWAYYYKNGTPKQEVEFASRTTRLDANPQIIFYNDSSGSRKLENGTGDWAEEYLLPSGHHYDLISNRGSYRLGAKNGEWTSKKNGKMVYREEYNYDNFESGLLEVDSGTKTKTYAEPVDNKLPPPARLNIMENFAAAPDISLKQYYPFVKPKPHTEEDNSIHTFAEKQPEFPGGSSAMVEFIARNVHASAFTKPGKVFVSFVVEKDGRISNVEVVKSVDATANQEAVRLVQSFPPWTPGYQDGKPVRIKFIVPLSVQARSSTR
jgi:TonB family protein